MSIYYGGQIYGNLGAFIQFSYSNDYARVFGMDNSDVRYTGQFNAWGTDVLWGLTANNRPTMQDVWNTTPVWSLSLPHLRLRPFACRRDHDRKLQPAPRPWAPAPMFSSTTPITLK